jgi:hypothetical protein
MPSSHNWKRARGGLAGLESSRWLRTKENTDMGILDTLVGRCFRDEQPGRVVVFPADRRKRGFLVKSEAEELKLRSFLKMFFYAHLAIFVLGYFLAYTWSMELAYALGRPAKHLLESIGLFLGLYAVIVGLPYFFLFRSYKKERLSFVSSQDEIPLTSGSSTNGLSLAWIAFAILILLGVGIVLLVQFK